jgi:crotonobetainyl-CoA:carnitine CoA-transferase CaiB-like acyl-CoA transferase
MTTRSPIHRSKSHTSTRKSAPKLGENSTEVLKNFGFNESDIKN